jgi:hypothetical protein
MRWNKTCETGAYPKRSAPVSHNAVPEYFAPSLWDAAGCMRGYVPGEEPRPLRVLALRLRLARHATGSAKCIVISGTVHLLSYNESGGYNSAVKKATFQS